MWGRPVYLKKVKSLDDLETNRHVEGEFVLPLGLLPPYHLNAFNVLARLIQNCLPDPNIAQQEQILNNLSHLLNDYMRLEANDYFVPEAWLEQQLDNLGILTLVAPPEDDNQEDDWDGFRIVAELNERRLQEQEAARIAVITLARARKGALHLQQWQQFQQENRPTQPGSSTVAMGNRFVTGFQVSHPPGLSAFANQLKRNFWRRKPYFP